jgi:hypothetical protein
VTAAIERADRAHSRHATHCGDVDHARPRCTAGGRGPLACPLDGPLALHYVYVLVTYRTGFPLALFALKLARIARRQHVYLHGRAKRSAGAQRALARRYRTAAEPLLVNSTFVCGIFLLQYLFYTGRGMHHGATVRVARVPSHHASPIVPAPHSATQTHDGQTRGQSRQRDTQVTELSTAMHIGPHARHTVSTCGSATTTVHYRTVCSRTHVICAASVTDCVSPPTAHLRARRGRVEKVRHQCDRR